MGGFLPRDLINEVKSRPGIYDRDALESPRRDKRHQLWLEVAENLTPAEDWEQYTVLEKVARIDEIQAKWKHLRDHYHRELKLIDAGEAHKKRKYVYFDDMSFMRPFVGFNMPPLRLDKETNKSPETVDDCTYAENGHTVSDDNMESLLQSDDTTVEENEKLSVSPVQILPNLRPRRTIKPTPKVIPKPAPRSLRSSKNKRNDLKQKNTSQSSKYSPATTSNPVRIRDSDITFCLSLVPSLRKSTDSKKLRAKIEILKVLHKYTVLAEQSHNKSSQLVEYDDETNMPEDHLEDNEEFVAINVVKTEGLEGNNKTWWT